MFQFLNSSTQILTFFRWQRRDNPPNQPLCRFGLHGGTVFLLLIFLSACNDPVPVRLELEDTPVPVFVSGRDGYACFRIPALLALPEGRLLAFAEGRKYGCSDTGDIDLVMKHSEDGGATWSPLFVVWDDSSNTCGNPAPVLHLKTGRIVMLTTWNLGIDREPAIIDQTSMDTRRVFLLSSEDQGRSWSPPQEITGDTKQENWTWYATGPGSGIQLKHPPHVGRLVVACDHIEAGSKKYFSHIIFSDDGGVRWQLGGSTPDDQVNECEVAELRDGRLLLNMRNYDRNQQQRQIAYSEDGGMTWIQQRHDTTLIEPICQASLHQYEFGKYEALLFSNPASREARVNMTLRWSEDEGNSWPQQLVLHPGPAAYSDLAVLNDGTVGCLFEAGRESPYEQLIFQKIAVR